MHAFFDAFLKTGENYKSCIISKKLTSQKSMCKYLKIFKILYHFRFDTVASQKYLGGLQVELLLGNMAAQK